jgi:hypothetical protein
MGVKGLFKLINKATITWNTLNTGIDADQRDSMVVAVDGPNLVHEMLHVHGTDVMAWGSVQPVVDSIMTLRIRPLLRAGASLIVIFDGEPGRQAVVCGSLAGSTGGSKTAFGTLGCSGAHSPTTNSVLKNTVPGALRSLGDGPLRGRPCAGQSFSDGYSSCCAQS